MPIRTKVSRFLTPIFRFFTWWLKWVGMLILIGTPVFVFEIAFLSADWKYEIVDGRIQRAWHVKLPGYKGYTDFDDKGPVVYHRFSMTGYRLRVGPWIEPEWDADAQE